MTVQFRGATWVALAHVRSLSLSEGVLLLSINYREILGQTALKSMWFGYIPEVVWVPKFGVLFCSILQSLDLLFLPQELVISVLNLCVSIEPGLISKDHFICLNI